MTKISLLCVVIGRAGSAFGVKIDDGEKVWNLKEEIAKKKMYQFPADQLQIFLTKKEVGGWLSSKDEAVIAMRSGKIPEQVKGLLHGELDPADKIEEHFGGPLLMKTIHVLVKAGDLPAPFPPWDVASTQFPPLTFDISSPLHHIPATYAENSGLRVKEDGLMLYQREGVTEEWDALLASVVKTYAQLWIIGPPGTGKSLAAFAFACKLKRVNGDLGGDWDVLWISCPKGRDALLSCILFRGEDKKWTCSIRARDLDALLKTIPDNTIIFLDGFAIDSDNDKAASVTSCAYWRSCNKPSRRLVIIASMVSLGKQWKAGVYPPIPSTSMNDQERFNMYSWTLTEFQEALKHDAMFTHVMKMFGVNNCVPVEKRMELVTVKFYVVGGSARMMFDLSTDEAETALTDALRCTDDILKYVEGTIGIESPPAINRLFAWYPNHVRSAPLHCLVSSYVAREISLRVGPERLQALAVSLAKNPAMDGHMLEMWFFSSLIHGGVQCHELDGKIVRKAEEWPKSEVNDFDPESNDAIDLALPQMWFEPLKWNNGGFDAVFVDFQDIADTDTTARQAGYRHKLHVRFVQVTRSETHSYKAEFF